MRLSTLALPLLSTTLLLACAPAEVPAPTAAPTSGLAGQAAGWNVLLLSVDTLRADHLGAYGYAVRPTSRRIDKLIASGVRFELAVAPRALTWPSLATVLTGLYPSGHGVIQNGYDLPDGLPALPTRLQAAGYQTAAFLSNMCQANHQGWDVNKCGKASDSRTVRKTLAWAEEADRARPFFLWVHLFGTHSPYSNGRNLALKRLDPDYGGTLAAKKGRLDAVVAQSEQLTARDVEHLQALYDAALIGTDRRIARLLAALRELGLLERTLIVFLADHGEDLYQHHGYLYHACSVYQSALHVPLAFAAPGLLPAGATVAQAVELGDVTPTLLDLLGLPPLEEAHGVSLLPYLEGAEISGRGRPAFSEYGGTEIRTVVQDGWKLVDNPEGETPHCFANGPPGHYPIAESELYDLRSDPAEQNNMAAHDPQRVAALQRLIHGRFATLTRRATPQVLSPELEEELRSLGYVGQ